MFKADRFTSAKFEPRTEEIKVPALAEFFDEGEPPVFKVRGLDATELCRAIDAGAKQGKVDAIVKAISSQKDQVDEIRKALGMSADTPGEIAKRMELLVLGSVEPKLNHAAVAKFAEVAPIEFYDITNRITILTGQGGQRPKSPPSSQAESVS